MKKYVMILAAFVLFGVYASGQDIKGSIKVRILDAHGAVVPNANASLIQNGRVISTSTGDSDGRYEFKNVPSGEYLIEVKWPPLRPFRKQVSLTSAKTGYTEVVIAMEPCSDDPDIGKAPIISEEDRIEIIHALVDLSFKKKPVYFVPWNIDLRWLSADQKAKLIVRSRDELQEITEKDGSLSYYHVGRLVQRGGCVEASMVRSVTVTGELEDANMAGGATTYEFRKVSGRWVGEFFSAYIS